MHIEKLTSEHHVLYAKALQAREVLLEQLADLDEPIMRLLLEVRTQIGI